MIGVFSNVEIGGWYRAPGSSQCFEVVAIDLQSQTIELQYEDGAVAELDHDNWAELGALPVAGPSDANAAFDIDDTDYLNTEPDVMSGHDWTSPVERMGWR